MDLSEAAASSNFGQSAAKVGVVEPIAIIGLAFQFPQGAVTEDAFWDMLVNHRNTSTEYPKDRLNIDAFYSKDPKKRNTVSSGLFPRAPFISERKAFADRKLDTSEMCPLSGKRYSGFRRAVLRHVACRGWRFGSSAAWTAGDDLPRHRER
jgi:hypothetical protein